MGKVTLHIYRNKINYLKFNCFNSSMKVYILVVFMIPNYFSRSFVLWKPERLLLGSKNEKHRCVIKYLLMQQIFPAWQWEYLLTEHENICSEGSICCPEKEIFVVWRRWRRTSALPFTTLKTRSGELTKEINQSWSFLL